jgi:hypothetical protein
MEYYTNMDKKYFDFSKALQETYFNDFVRSLFFDGCKMAELPNTFSGALAFPSHSSSDSITNEIMILTVRRGLKEGGKPVLVQDIYGLKNIDGTQKDSQQPHCLLISGYKQVVNPNNLNDKKQLFKIHNSYGIEWQLEHNNGWVDAENFINSLGMFWDKNKKYLRHGNNQIIWMK